MNRVSCVNRIHRSLTPALVAGCLALGLGACSEEAADRAEDEVVEEVDERVDEEYQVTYEVTGEKVDSIDFNAGGGSAADPKFETVDNPTLPWKKTVTLRGIEAPAVIPVTLDTGGGSGELSCRIVHEGEVLAEKSGAGAVSAAGCVAVSPVTG
ncbi:MmpS family transport accessory protein [Streptomyces sp. AC558_RSS880]|uniref:MmpS family transport accessory protein n=1 Tax=Streptomyces sp. AC558_RSS880 TaxID=2823687 RepID=UPI001C2470E3|nr:MmpS family transport accessory protein [Streptomyces sp. AC558_RSS880]